MCCSYSLSLPVGVVGVLGGCGGAGQADPLLDQLGGEPDGLLEALGWPLPTWHGGQEIIRQLLHNIHYATQEKLQYMANEILNQHVVENGTNFCVFSKKGKSHRLIRTDRLHKRGAQNSCLILFAARSYLLKIIGGGFEDYSIENKKYSKLEQPLWVALSTALPNPPSRPYSVQSSPQLF